MLFNSILRQIKSDNLLDLPFICLAICPAYPFIAKRPIIIVEVSTMQFGMMDGYGYGMMGTGMWILP